MTVQLLPDSGEVGDAPHVSIIVGGDVLLRAAMVEPADGGPEPLGAIARLLIACGFGAELVTKVFDADPRAPTDLAAAVQLLAKLKLVGRSPTLVDAACWLSLVVALRDVASPNDASNRARILFSSPRDFRCEMLGQNHEWGPASEGELLGIGDITTARIEHAIEDLRARRDAAEAPPPEHSIARMGGALDELARASWPG